MKTLYLLRHAHADAAELGQDDHDRRLSPRGETESENLGAFMKQQNLYPESAACSTSLRTRETLRIAAAKLFDGQGGLSARYERSLYLAHPETIIDEVREADDRFASLMIVGHNPGLEDIAERMAEGCAAHIGKFPPATLVVFECDIGKWEEFSLKKLRLKTVFMP
ncbi:MAG TPA: histidine phosphatase family protein [Patescibacteria group bacterium]|nr:histidine phosphatase family protein [Patescibacteria group bacterium]